MKKIKRNKNGGYLIIEVLDGYDSVNDGDTLVKLGKGNKILNHDSKVADYGIGRIIWEHNVSDKYAIAFKQYKGNDINHSGGYGEEGNCYLLFNGINHPSLCNLIKRKKNGGVLKIKPLAFNTAYDELVVGDEYVFLSIENKVLNRDSDLVRYRRIGKVIAEEGVKNRERVIEVMTGHLKSMGMDDRNSYFDRLEMYMRNHDIMG